MIFCKDTLGNLVRCLQLTIVTGFVLFSPSLVSAATYYVDGANLGGTCSNSANGTSLSTAWCTVQKAASTAVAGDTVYIREHTYRETVNVVNSGNVSNPITFTAYANEDPIISGADSPSNWSSLGDESGLGAAFSDGFEANDDTFSGYALNVDAGNTIEAQNIVTNNGDYAFAATFGGTNRNARITETSVDTSGGADVYTRFFFRINSNYDLLTNDAAQLIFQSRSSGVLRSRVNLFQNASGQFYINATAFNPANESQNTLGASAPGSIVPDTWYNVEIRYKGGDPTTGGAEAWLNGVSLGSIYTWPTSTTTIDRIEIGGNNGSSVPGAGSVLYIDDVIVSNAFNGVFDGGGEGQYTTPLSVRPLLVYENGEPLASSSRAALAPGRWHWDNVTEILYVQTTNGQNPSGIVDVAQRGNGFSLLNRSYVVFDGLTVELTNALASTLSNGQRFSGGAFSLASSSRITIRNANIRDNVGSGVALTGATNNTIASSTFTRNYRDFGGGIRLEAGSHDNLMAGNTITGIGLEGGNGINFCGDAANCQGVGNDRNIIRDNSFYNLFDSCVYVAARSNYNILERNRCGKPIRWTTNGINFGGGAGFHISRGSSYNIMRNNFFYDTETAGISIQSDTLDGVETAVYGNEVYNNTIYNPGTSYGGNHGGISVVADAYGTIIRNNIVYQSNLVMGIRVTDAAALSTVSDYNIYFSTRRNQTNTANVSDRVFHWGDSGDYYASISALRAVYPTQEVHSLLVDPDLTDAENGNFRLLLSSPAINAGMSVATVTDDFYQTSRPQGIAYDIGAHEYLSVAPDTTAPIITNRVATPSTSTALITWTTNEAADSLVEYGLTTSYGASTTLSASLVTSHSRTISGLTPNTLYYYRVRSRDVALNTASSTGSFTTTAAADITAPIISNRVATPSTSTAAVTWSTNEGADSLVEYGLTTSYASSTTVSSPLVTSHNRTLTGLSPNTLYYYRVRSRDAALNSSTQTGSFTTTNLPDTTGPIISSVVSSPATSSAIITWTTNEAADSLIDYGVTTGYGSTAALDSTLRTNHSRTVTGLSPNTLYYYRIRSRDGSLNSTTASGSFTTTNTPDITAPIISSMVATPSTSTATITWTTNEAADSFIDYGVTTGYGLTAALDATLRTSHSRTLTSLTASTTYFYRVRSRDGSLNSSTQTGSFFTTAEVVVGTSTPTTPPVVTPPRRGGGGGGGGGSRATKATTTSPTGFYLPPPTATTTLPQMLVTISALVSKPLPTSVSDLTQVVNYLKAVLIKLIQARTISVTQPTTPTTPTITTPVATLTFPRDLTVGSTGEDVRRLQQWLNQNGYLIARDGPGSPGNETTYYGPSTAFAVGRLQVTYGIKPYDGNFNAVTRGIVEGELKKR